MPWRARRVAAPILVAALLGAASGCAPSQEQQRAADLSASKPVSFQSSDGVKLEGRVFGTGPVGVVLSHMFPADQRSWWDFARILSRQGYTALTYDFRGYCPGGDGGCSEGTKDIAAIWQDVVGSIRFLVSRGVRRVMLVGASMGGTASFIAAAQPGVQVGAVIALSAPQSFEGLDAGPSVLANVTAAKLFIAGNADPTGAAQFAQTMYDEAPQPKRVEIFTSSDHGTELLTGSQLGRIQTLILQYLAAYSGQ